jgi:hypothetical protein
MKVIIIVLDYCTKSTFTDILGSNTGFKVSMYEKYGMGAQDKGD